MPRLLNAPSYQPEDLIGRLMADDRYQLTSQLGAGSMAYIYKAWDRRLETDVVVKIPRPEKITDDGFDRRFSQERSLLVKLSHPHIVRILDIGEHERLPYVVMQFLSGGDLLEKLKHLQKSGGKMKPKSVRKWVREMGRALDFVADQGMIHRDVKPANILFDEHQHPFLSDFGLTKIVYGDHLNGDSDMTAAGFIVGTPNYVAPEIVLAEEYDCRVDQYALGLVVYHMMVGEPPMQGASSSATMVNQTRRVLPLLSDVRTDVPRRMAKVVQKAISKKKEDRFETSEEFAEALLASLEQRPKPRPVSSNSSSSNVASKATTDPYASDYNLDLPLDSGAEPKISTGRKGLVPCPHCKRPLPLKPLHAGRKGRCVHCHSRLKVGKELTKLYLLATIDAPGEQARKEKTSGSSGDLLIGDEVFGWKLSKSQAIGLAIFTLVFLIASTVYITVFLNSETDEERLEREVNKARITEQKGD